MLYSVLGKAKTGISEMQLALLELVGARGHCEVTVKSPSSSTTFAKAYGIKVRCLYAEHVEERIVNLGNILGTH